uniref:Uncharacterized protein n=1 Tax=Moorena producens (strain JHB) TaxID=1454205 RepID=A0A1D9G517_MOOP1
MLRDISVLCSVRVRAASALPKAWPTALVPAPFKAKYYLLNDTSVAISPRVIIASTTIIMNVRLKGGSRGFWLIGYWSFVIIKRFNVDHKRLMTLVNFVNQSVSYQLSAIRYQPKIFGHATRSVLLNKITDLVA